METSFGSTIASTVRDSGGGRPLVLLPGGGSTIAMWTRFAESWSHERPVIAIDTVWDAGRSTQTRPIVEPAQAATWLDETLVGLEIDQAHIVGYSYGGWIALNQAVHAPSRLCSVTAIEPSAAITGMPLRAWWKMAGMLRGGERQYRAYLQWARGGRLPDSPMLDVLLSARTDFVPGGSPQPRRLSAGQWQEMDTPLAVILGGRSRMVPTRRAAAVVRRDAPQVDLTIFPDAGHAVPVDEPELVVESVRRFVNHHDRASR